MGAEHEPWWPAAVVDAVWSRGAVGLHRVRVVHRVSHRVSSDREPPSSCSRCWSWLQPGTAGLDPGLFAGAAIVLAVGRPS